MTTKYEFSDGRKGPWRNRGTHSKRELDMMHANAVVFGLRLRHGESLESIKQSMVEDKNPRVKR